MTTEALIIENNVFLPQDSIGRDLVGSVAIKVLKVKKISDLGK